MKKNQRADHNKVAHFHHLTNTSMGRGSAAGALLVIQPISVGSCGKQAGTGLKALLAPFVFCG
jgi:hypothetical protein